MNQELNSSFVKRISDTSWHQPAPRLDWAQSLEAGEVLHFNGLLFAIAQSEERLFTDNLLAPKSRNLSLDSRGVLKGFQGPEDLKVDLSSFILRFRGLANDLVNSAFPRYCEEIRIAPTSFRPKEVESRKQSVRADDRRLHVDAFPSRPNYGERILRVFLNINPNGKPRVWRIGEPFEDIANRFIPGIKKYSYWKAKALNAIQVTKSLRSEYDHLMLGIHDAMKQNDAYQKSSPQLTYEFAPHSVWLCFSDQTAHAAMSGQFMMEQTYHLPVSSLYNPSSSPLAVLERLTHKELI